ncbi:hypothetical protein ACHAPU_001529 [Fusarium lateritium]
MGVFFIDWDLWQEMTFVLGCCIVLVFALGFIKLWWSNRNIRRLEIIDEEKRARVSLMTHCGIDNMRTPEIPFGIRAIQSGIEVEGIWISRPNSPEFCQLTSAATLVGRQIRISKGKGKMIDLGSSECIPATLTSEATPTRQGLPHISHQGDAVAIVNVPSQQIHNQPVPMTTKAHVDPIGHPDLRENLRHGSSLTSSSRNDAFVTPEQTPPASTLGHTEAPEKERGTIGPDAVFNIEQPHGTLTTNSKSTDAKKLTLDPSNITYEMAAPIMPEVASTGFNDAQSYDTHRPSYPPAAVGSLLERLSLEGQPGRRILDLAAGTGKFTELLAARPEEYEIIAVEPLDSMRNNLAAKQLPKVDARPGTAADMKHVGDGWADACIVAQAFHWFAKEESLEEIHRVLKPGAKLGLIWNAEDYNRPATWPASTNWEHELSELNFNEKADSEPRFRHLLWKQVFERQAKVDNPFFSTPIETGKVTWSVWLTPEALWDRFNTLSWNAIRQGEERRLFREKFNKIVKEGDAEVNEKGEVELHGCTFFVWVSRLDSPEGP